MFEQGITGAWFARHSMASGPEPNVGTFQHQNKVARDGKIIMRSMAIYGRRDRRFIGVWHANPGYTKWHVHYADDGANYQTVFNANPGPRSTVRTPKSPSDPDHLYCSLFKDDMVGPWVARHGMTSAEYQSEFDAQNGRGLYPISVQGGGSGSDTRYAAIFARRDIPLPRHWHVTGTEVPSLAGSTTQCRPSCRRTRCVPRSSPSRRMARQSWRGAYTWAEDGYRITQPSDRFLLASCSKMFLEAAVQSLYDAGKLKPNSTVYPMLGFSHPANSRSDSITIQQLLDHMGGYDDANRHRLGL